MSLEDPVSYPVSDVAPIPFFVASSRLPVTLSRDDAGHWRTEPAGGVLTALAPVLDERGGTWVGWPGVSDTDPRHLQRLLSGALDSPGYRLRAVNLTRDERKNYDAGFGHQILWPLFHSFLDHCRFEPEFWQGYLRVNRKFADALAASDHGASDLIWVDDYHLISLAAGVRRLGMEVPLAFFLHIPFPPPDLFVRLPWARTLLRDFLSYDLLGFQTTGDLKNFVDTACRLGVRQGDPTGRPRVRLHLPACGVREEAPASGPTPAREIRLGVFPMAVDAADFRARAMRPGVARRSEALRARYGGNTLLVGIDRLDYTKGILEKLHGFATLLSQHRELRRTVSLVQVVMPSRDDLPGYRELRRRIERLVGEINGRWGEPGWIPVIYSYRALDRDELVAHYRAADVGVVTPLKDGMNLVAKELCTVDLEEKRALVLSEFAGAAEELASGALLVNPYDSEALARRLRQAILLSPGERRQRMHQCRTALAGQDVESWARSFLDAAAAVPIRRPLSAAL